MKVDTLIVGAGITGSTVAECLTHAGRDVLVVEKRNHIAGNCFDYYNSDGVLVSKYGAHIFRTSDKEIWNYLSQFVSWRDYTHRVRAEYNGELYPMPINRQTLEMFYDVHFNDEEGVRLFLDEIREDVTPTNAKTQVTSQVGTELYEAFFENYTKKQWKRDPEELDKSITAQIPVRTNYDDTYFSDEFEGVPEGGFTNMCWHMLKDARVWLNTSYEEAAPRVKCDHLVFTGPIDAYFGYKHGKLPWRSLEFESETFEENYHLPLMVVNYPNAEGYTRKYETKHATGQDWGKTTVVTEYPAGTDPNYPVLTKESKEMLARYEEEASKLDNVHFVGRLGEFAYLNMDKAVRHGLDLAKKLNRV